jgi:hypothetical protein
MLANHDLVDMKFLLAKLIGRRLNDLSARPPKAAMLISSLLSSRVKIRRGRLARRLQKRSRRLTGVPLRVAKSLRRASMVRAHGRLRSEVEMCFWPSLHL